MQVPIRYSLYILLFFFVKINSHAVTAAQTSILTTEQSTATQSIKDSKDSWKRDIIENKHFVQNLAFKTNWSLPVGLRKVIGNNEYIIIIDDIYTDKNSRYFNASAVINIPERNEPLYFRTTKIPITESGIGTGSTQIQLIENVPLDLNNVTHLEILAQNQKTYVEIECGGYKQISVEGKFTFAKSFLVSENSDGTPNESLPVTAHFHTQAAEWSDMIVSLSMTPFQVKGLNGFTFQPNQVSLDKSDLNNPSGMKFPQNYKQEFLSVLGEESWTGIYIHEASVKLPKVLSPTGGNRKELTAKHLLIDNQGISGTLGGNNILSSRDGSIGKWPFSIDSLAVSFYANQLQQAKFTGAIKTALISNQPIGYAASIGLNDEYFFSTSALRNVHFRAWSAEVELYRNSSIEIAYENNRFKASLLLHGHMNIQARLNFFINNQYSELELNDENYETIYDENGVPDIRVRPEVEQQLQKEREERKKNKDIEIADISFENLRLSSEAPYLQFGDFSFDSEKLSVLKNFPISIQNISPMAKEGKIGLNLDVVVQLMDKDDKGFGGHTNINVLGKLDETGNINSWKPAGVEVNELSLDIITSSFEFHGFVALYREHETYGNGFNGQIQATFKPGVTVDARAQFGNVDGFAYWYVDASVTLPRGIPIGAGLSLYGFIGGARYHMTTNYDFLNQATNIDSDSPTIIDPGNTLGINETTTTTYQDTEGNTVTETNTTEYVSGGIKEYDNKTPVGDTRSGATYIPDRRIGLGIKAGVTLGTTGKPDAFNADAIFEIAFFTGGGISQVQFIGDAYFMTNIKDRGNPTVRATMSMSYLPEGKVFHASLDTYFNLADGMVQGTGNGGHAGKAVFHTAEGEGWYLHIGTPNQPISLYLLKALRTESYFMMGTKIEPFQDVPNNVREILSERNTSLMPNENTLANAGGFAFGSKLQFDTGDITFLIFYGRIRAGAGFDVMLTNYGHEARCKGRSGPLGFGGWYASGQAWAYLRGEVGVKVKLKIGLLKIEKKIKVLNVGAAALLQAKLPNPTYMRGMIGGDFSVLGGLVKGKIKFKFTLGEECDVVGAPQNPLLAMPIIQDLTPAEGESDVDVFTVPQATLNIPVNKAFEMNDENNNTRQYRVRLDFIRLVDQDSKQIEGHYTLNQANDVIAFHPHEVLAPHSKMEAQIQVSFEQYKDARWQTVIEDGKAVIDVMQTTFETGEAPTHIPQNNIVYSYPIAQQLHLHPKETINAYIQLGMGQAYLFEQDKTQWKQIARYTNTLTEQTYLSNLAYDAQNKRVNFNVPADLALNAVYQLDIINQPVEAMGTVDQNITRSDNSLGDGELADISQRNISIEGSLSELKENTLLTYHFKSSKYATFTEKMQALQAMNKGWEWPIQTGVHRIGINLKGDEYFDDFEINGASNIGELIYIEASATNYWLKDILVPHVYKPYPLGDLTLQWRDTERLGIVPLKAVRLMQYPDDEKLNASDPNAGPFNSNASFTTIEYNVPVVSYYDLYDLKQQAAVKISAEQKPNAIYFEYLGKEYKKIGKGHYDVKLQYVLPGINKVTSTYDLKIQL